MATTIQAIPTNVARQNISRLIAYGTSFKVVGFVINDGGHDLTDPSLVLAPSPATIDPRQTTDSRQGSDPPIFPSGGFEYIDEVVFTSSYCGQYKCVVNSTEGIGGHSSICLIAEFIYIGISDPSPPNLGDTFVYAVGNFPLKYKSVGEIFTYYATVLPG